MEGKYFDLRKVIGPVQIQIQKGENMVSKWGMRWK